VGEDDFVVPKSFDEFYKRYPKYVLDWAKKRLNRFKVDEDVEDDTQDLWIYLKFSPARSFNRGEADMSGAMAGSRGGSSRTSAFPWKSSRSRTPTNSTKGGTP
jgi:hypothetical protein